MRGYQLLASIFVLSSAAIVVHQIVTEPAESFTGLAMVLAGLPVYWIWTRQRSR